MRSLSAIQDDLHGKTKPQRKMILEKEVASMNEHEKNKYTRFYEFAYRGLRTKKRVGIVVRELDRAGLFFQSQSYFPLEYALSCIVTGNPVQEPIEVIRDAKKKKPYKLQKRARVPKIFRVTFPPIRYIEEDDGDY